MADCILHTNVEELVWKPPGLEALESENGVPHNRATPGPKRIPIYRVARLPSATHRAVHLHVTLYPTKAGRRSRDRKGCGARCGDKTVKFTLFIQVTVRPPHKASFSPTILGSLSIIHLSQAIRPLGNT